MGGWGIEVKRKYGDVRGIFKQAHFRIFAATLRSRVSRRRVRRRTVDFAATPSKDLKVECSNDKVKSNF